MSEYFSEFKWALSKSYTDPLSKCRFEQGDIIYDTSQAYSLPWGEAKQIIKSCVQIKSPSRNLTAITIENTETAFKNNWNSKVTLDLLESPGMSKKEIETTQGNLYSMLWKGDISFIYSGKSSCDIPMLLKDVFKLSKIILPCLTDYIKNHCDSIFYFPIDETSSLSKAKIAKIKRVLNVETIEYKMTIITPTSLNLLNTYNICPTVKIILYEIIGKDVDVKEALKKALYVPDKNKKTEEDMFRLKAHGTFIKDYSYKSSEQKQVEL